MGTLHVVRVLEPELALCGFHRLHGEMATIMPNEFDRLLRYHRCETCRKRFSAVYIDSLPTVQ
jgi:hypothetical protein